MDDVLGQRMRRHDRNNKHLLVTKRWKRSIGLIAAGEYSVLIGFEHLRGANSPS